VPDTSSAEGYVSGKLSEEEIALFEAEMIKRPELAAEVDVRQRIKLGMSLLEERQELEDLLSTRAPERRWLKIAVAASIVSVAAGSLYVWRADTGGPMLYAAGGAVSSTPILPLFRSRSDDAPPRIVSEDPVGLRVVVAGEANSIYDAQLLSATGELLAELAEVRADEHRSINLLLKPGRLKPGRLQLVLTLRGGETESFPIVFAPDR
jgi:hypothetical protein